MDEETGLYYYGARYLDPKASIWISSDPALGEYIPQAGKGNSKDAGSLPGMGGVYNHINFNLYHYAGNNPIKYKDPDGRRDREILIDSIMKDATISDNAYYLDSDYPELGFKRTYTISKEAEEILKSISTKACTHGAISFRNEYSKIQIPLIESAKILRESKYLNYYKDSKGNIEKDPAELYKKMKIGDVLIYLPDIKYLNEQGVLSEEISFTGHTATIIGKGTDKYGNFFDILEFHTQKPNEKWNPATITRVYVDTLRSFSDCELYGGASWN